MEIVTEYFSRNRYRVIIPYVDFYSKAIMWGLQHAGYASDTVRFVNEVRTYDDYLDLLDTRRLLAFDEVVALAEKECV